jgi:hypothetical protein
MGWAGSGGNAVERLENRRWVETGWTKKQLARLGIRLDAELAKLFGRSQTAGPFVVYPKTP